MVKWGENTSFFCALPVKWYEVLSVMRFITQCTSATYYVIAVPCSELVERTIELMPLFVQFVLKYRELFPTMYERCDSNADLANGLCTVQGRNEPLCMVVELSGNVAGGEHFILFGQVRQVVVFYCHAYDECTHSELTELERDLIRLSQYRGIEFVYALDISRERACAAYTFLVVGFEQDFWSSMPFA